MINKFLVVPMLLAMLSFVSNANAKQISFANERISFILSDDIAYVKKSEYDSSIINPQGIANSYLNYSFSQDGIVVLKRENELVSIHALVGNKEIERANNAENIYGRVSDSKILSYYDGIFSVIFSKKSYDSYRIVGYGKKYVNSSLYVYATVEAIVRGTNNVFYMNMSQTAKNGIAYTIQGVSQISKQKQLDDLVENIISNIQFH